LDKKDKSALYLFILLAFGISWGFWLIAFLFGYRDISFVDIINWEFAKAEGKNAFLLFRIGIYGPLLASLVATYFLSGTRGLRDLFTRIFKWNVGWKWYLFMVLIPLGISLLSVLVGVILGVPFGEFFSGGIPLSLIFIFFLYQVFTSGLEEPGWRGFALDLLQKKYNAEKTSWILGLIWAIWHYPYVVFIYSDTGFFAIVMSLVGFSMAIIGQTFIFTWFYNNTRSVLISILFHAMLNTSTTFILGEITLVHPVMGIIPALITWGIVVILLKRFGGEKLMT